MKKDTLLGLSMAIVSAVMIWQANILPPGNRWDLLGPSTYPKYVSWGLLLLSAMLLLSSLKTPGKDHWDWSSYVLPGITFLILYAYVVIMPRLGFIISTLGFLAVLQYVLSPVNKKPWLSIGLVSVGFTFGIYYLFTNLLHVNLPSLF
ncbi:MAG: tripartite tricarboxylate transporter TctB family protein [Bacillota bacterium]